MKERGREATLPSSAVSLSRRVDLLREEVARAQQEGRDVQWHGIAWSLQAAEAHLAAMQEDQTGIAGNMEPCFAEGVDKVVKNCLKGIVGENGTEGLRQARDVVAGVLGPIFGD